MGFPWQPVDSFSAIFWVCVSRSPETPGDLSLTALIRHQTIRTYEHSWCGEIGQNAASHSLLLSRQLDRSVQRRDFGPLIKASAKLHEQSLIL